MEETPPVEGTPDPTDVVHVLKSDFDMLQKAVNLAYEGVKELSELLGFDMERALLENPQLTPHDVLTDALMPKVAELMITKGFVDAAREDIKTAAAKHGNKTIETGGKKGLLVGKSLGADFFDKSRRERRQIAREARRRG